MVRFHLITTNNIDDAFQSTLDFSNLGDLVRPYSGEKLFIRSFSIPNSSIPIVSHVSTKKYYISLMYDGLRVGPTKLIFIDRGTGDNFYNFTHICDCLNITLSTLVTSLNTLSGGTLPTIVVPYVYYDASTQVFNLCAPAIGYSSQLATPIHIHISTYLRAILSKISSEVILTEDFRSRYRFIFNPSYENEYRTTYIRLKQESISMDRFTTNRAIAVFANMPVTPEVICSETANSNQSTANIIGLYIPNTNGGLNSVGNNNYFAPTNEYRLTPINAKNIYSIKCTFKYLDTDGTFNDILLPAGTSAIVTLELL